MEAMVRRFKSDFRYLHVFVILFKQDDNRLTSALRYSTKMFVIFRKLSKNVFLRDMLEVFQSTFGPEFWRNVILEATHWSYSPGMVRYYTSPGLSIIMTYL